MTRPNDLTHRAVLVLGIRCVGTLMRRVSVRTADEPDYNWEYQIDQLMFRLGESGGPIFCQQEDS